MILLFYTGNRPIIQNKFKTERDSLVLEISDKVVEQYFFVADLNISITAFVNTLF